MIKIIISLCHVSRIIRSNGLDTGDWWIGSSWLIELKSKQKHRWASLNFCKRWQFYFAKSLAIESVKLKNWWAHLRLKLKLRTIKRLWMTYGQQLDTNLRSNRQIGRGKRITEIWLRDRDCKCALEGYSWLKVAALHVLVQLGVCDNPRLRYDYSLARMKLIYKSFTIGNILTEPRYLVVMDLICRDDQSRWVPLLLFQAQFGAVAHHCSSKV